MRSKNNPFKQPFKQDIFSPSSSTKVKMPKIKGMNYMKIPTVPTLKMKRSKFI